MRLRERFREETSAAILDAAEAVIGESGLHATRMERIAATAGVSVGTLYNHFEDRNAILGALRTSRVGQLRGRLGAMLEEVLGRPAREQVRAFLATLASHGQRHGRFFSALMQEQMGPTTLRPPSRVQSELLPVAREILARGAASGELREDPTDLRADALVALARLLLVRTVDGHGGDAEIDALADLFLAGASR